MPTDMKNSDFLSFLYNKLLMKYTKPKVNFGNRVRILKKDIPFRKDTSQSYQMKFLKLRKIYEKASYIHYQRF